MRGHILEHFARIGFVVKGVVYLMLGTLALMAGLGAGGRLTDPLGAIATLVGRPFGRITIALLAIGLGFYAGWRFLEAFADANRVGRSRGGMGKRVAWGLSGAVYGLLAIDAARLALRAPSSGNPGLPPTLLASPLTPWLVVGIAFVVIGYGVKELRAALARRLSERLNLRKLSRDTGRLVVEISRAGIVARAVVMIALGTVLLRLRANPRAAASDTDMADSLRLVAALSAGPWLLVLLAAGLVAYGVYQLVHARYRVITPP